MLKYSLFLLLEKMLISHKIMIIASLEYNVMEQSSLTKIVWWFISLPGVKKDLTSYGPHDSSAACNGADAFDFISSGSESEEDDEVRQQRLKAYAEKRAKSMTYFAT